MAGMRLRHWLRLIAPIAVILALVALAWLQFGPHGSIPAEANGTVNVDVGNNWFCDVSSQGGVCDTTVAAGTTVNWNFTAGLHTSTECGDNFANANSCPGGVWDSGVLTTGASFQRTFDEEGTFYYLCTVHPVTMRGRIIVTSEEKATETPAETSTPTAIETAEPTSTTTPVSQEDTDGDGCTNVRELGDDAILGGQRDPNNFWDFFDPDRNRSVTVVDFFALLQRFGAVGDPGIDPLSEPPPPPEYHTRFDRGIVIGPNPWNLGPPNGAIALADFFALLVQFGHSCG